MVAKTPELFTHDADGNLTQDGTFVYEWDGENRLKAIITRYEIGEYITPFRLDFAYDYMGRRIMKRYSRYEGDFHDLVETPGGELKSWASDYEQRFVWDGKAPVVLIPLNPPTATERRDLHQLPVAGICQSGPPLLPGRLRKQPALWFSGNAAERPRRRFRVLAHVPKGSPTRPPVGRVSAVPRVHNRL